MNTTSMMKNKLFQFAGIFLAMTLSPCRAEQPLNAELPAVFDPPPTYPLCTDEGDAMQLSDGLIQGGNSVAPAASGQETGLLPGMNPELRGSASLWGLKSTVGWMHTRKPILVYFDLGASKRIGALKVHSAAGASGVYWPAVIAMVVSDDGKTWRYAGELISRSRNNGLPPAMDYTEHLFVADDLNIEGRYVGLCVHTGGTPFFFTDEIEIHAGDASKPADVLPEIGDLEALRKYVTDNTVGYGTLRRQAIDYSLIQKAIRDSGIDAEKKAELEARLRELDAACNEVSKNLPEKFRTVIPINDVQVRLLSIRGSLLREQGYPPLFVSKIHRNAYLAWLQTPEKTDVELSWRQMRDEVRGDLFLLTNAMPEAQKVALTLSPASDAVSVFYSPWTDTPQLEPVATALLAAAKTGEGWEVEIPAGLTLKVWVSVDGSKLPVGRHDYKLRITGAQTVEVPMKMDISPVAMGGERLHLGMWDYTAGNGHHEITRKNRDAAIRLMRSHGVDSPWIQPGHVPKPKPEDFDEADNLRRRLDFTAFNEWLALWPDARRYMVFVHVGENIGGEPIDSPRFSKRVQQWAQALADNVAAAGVEPERVHLLLVDEPGEDKWDALMLAWAKPIREAGTGMKIWNDPVWKTPALASHPEAFTLPDALCPNWGILDAGGRAQWKFYQKLREEGKPMELYMCSALAPHTDPNRYYRLMPWAGWKLRIQGIGFWAFGDAGGLADAWSAYQGSGGRIWYTPVFLDENDATDTLQWQAVREGMLDYEYLRQLEKCLPDIRDEALRKEAENLLSERTVRKVFHGWKAKDGADWRASDHWDAPDIYRQEILAVLEKIQTTKP